MSTSSDGPSNGPSGASSDAAVSPAVTGRTAERPVAVIRKYANRRLYDTSRARCVTLADIASRLRAGERVRVVNARGGGDVTRQVLIQILCDSEMADESRGMLDEEVLARLIRLSSARAGRGVSAAIARALDQIEGAPETPPHAAGALYPRGRETGRAVAARLDALEARLRSLISAADKGAARRASRKPR
jgi:polyhydroxyalkanoate synthesis repressor PhaR